MGGFGKFRKRQRGGDGEIDDFLHIRGERDVAPPAPNDGAGGYLYTKSDGKPY